MTDRVAALRELLVSVEVGGDVYGFGSLGTPLIRGYGESAYNGSLDAAMALHKAVLGDAWLYPSWIPHRSSGDDGVTVELYPAVAAGPEEQIASGDPARAWLICILKALIAMEEAND